jgi:hypothetical protein
MLSLALAFGCAGALSAQQPAAAVPANHRGAFVARLGVDTLVVERFQRSGGAYNVEQVLHVPRASLRHTHLELSPSGEIGTVMYMHHQIGAPVDAPLLGSTTLTFAGRDSARVETKGGDSVQTRTVAAQPTMVPALPDSWLPYEIAAMRLRASGADSATMQFLNVGGNAMPVIVRTLGADSLTFELPFLVYRAHVDRDGRVTSLYQPNGVRVVRLPTVDINAVAARWDSVDKQGRAMGPLSPLDTTAARIGSADVRVVYSRPSVRGRIVWGQLVPWHEVWRTGANAATVLHASRDLTIGGTRVPAGSFTLFTLPTPTGTHLIISKETMRDGQPLAGTAFDPAHELARIPMTTEPRAQPVEQFTIAVEPGAGNTGTLVMAWADRRMTAPIEVR